MIRSLAREQLRAQRGTFMWSALVIAIAVGIASYGALLTVTMNDAQQRIDQATGYNAQYTSYGGAGVGATPADGFIAFEDVTAAVDAAIARDIDVTAHIATWQFGLTTAREGWWPGAARGTVDWDSLLIEGRAPATGEVAISEALAKEEGWGIGDTVPVIGNFDTIVPLGAEVTVVGITASPFTAAGLGIYTLSHVWFAWDDMATFATLTDDAGAPLPMNVVDVQLYWSGEDRALTELFDTTTEQFDGAAAEIGTTGWVALATGTMIIGVIAMAFAFGRAQAQARSQWVATARALGATRRHVVGAAMLEAALVAVIAAAIGYALGAAGATVHLSLVHAQVPGAAVPSSVWWEPLVLLGALGLSAMLALIVAGVPAFWSARVTPASALKTETDVTTAEVSRRVGFRPVVIAWAVAGGAGAIGTSGWLPTSGALGTAVTVTTIVAAVVFFPLSIVVANEATRWVMPRMGAMLGRRPEKTALIAGDAIAARPRQHTVPALLLALGVGVLITASVPALLEMLNQNWDSYGGIDEVSWADLRIQAWPTWLVPAAAIVMAGIGLLTMVIAVATSHVTQSELATREALGASRAVTRGAAALAHSAALITGIVVGAFVGSIVTATLIPSRLAGDPAAWVPWDAAASLMAEAVGVVIVAALVVTAVTSLAVGVASRNRVPDRSSEHHVSMKV